MYGINIFIDNLTIVILFQMCNNLHDLYNYLENYCEYMKHTENIYVYICGHVSVKIYALNYLNRII